MFGAIPSAPPSSVGSPGTNTGNSPRQSGLASASSSARTSYNNAKSSIWGAGDHVSVAEQLAALPFVGFYQREPKPGEASFTMDEIFRLASRRMTLLHTLQEKQDQLSFGGANFASSNNDESAAPFVASSASAAHVDRTSALVSGLLGYTSLSDMISSARPRLEPDVAYEPTIRQNMEDYVSHWACRLAFCQDGRWTEWFVKNERILFREKLRIVFVNLNSALSQQAAAATFIGGFSGAAPSSSNSSPSNISISNNLSMMSPSTTSNSSSSNANSSNNTINSTNTNNNNSTISSFLHLFPSSKAEPLTKQFLGDDFTAGILFDFFHVSVPSYQHINPAERDSRRIEFIRTNVHPNLYTVPFTAVKDLVKRRRVFVLKGCAIVQQGDLIDYITQQFADTIRRSTRQAVQTRRSILEDVSAADASTSPKATLLSMLDSVFKNCIVNPVLDLQAVVETQEGSITLADVQRPALAQQHMPPCMLAMDQALRTEGHLKHNGRWQYGLFLKASGLKMLDALRFFAETMTQKGGGVEQFNKSAYGYGIRHMYGKEGKHTDYSALTCPTMINGPSPNTAADRTDCSGCPFKTLDEGNLRRTLAVKRIGRTAPTPADIEEIIEDKRGFHFTRACRRYFTAIHGGVVTHDGQLFKSPVEFFAESRAVDQQEKEAKEGGKGAGDRRERGSGGSNNNNHTNNNNNAIVDGGAGGNAAENSSARSSTSTIVVAVAARTLFDNNNIDQQEQQQKQQQQQ